MKTAKQAARQAEQLFRLCLVNGEMDQDRVLLVVKRVIEGKRRGYLLLLSNFQRLVRIDRDRHTARVESAVPLPRDLQFQVQNGIGRRYGPQIAVQFTSRPELIGGMRIKVGSDVYDGSVRFALETLEKRL